MVDAAVLLDGSVKVEFVGNFKFALKELRYTAARPVKGPGFLLALTIDQLPVNPMLFALPVELIFPPSVPVRDS